MSSDLGLMWWCASPESPGLLAPACLPSAASPPGFLPECCESSRLWLAFTVDVRIAGEPGTLSIPLGCSARRYLVFILEMVSSDLNLFTSRLSACFSPVSQSSEEPLRRRRCSGRAPLTSEVGCRSGTAPVVVVNTADAAGDRSFERVRRCEAPPSSSGASALGISVLSTSRSSKKSGADSFRWCEYRRLIRRLGLAGPSAAAPRASASRDVKLRDLPPAGPPSASGASSPSRRALPLSPCMPPPASTSPCGAGAEGGGGRGRRHQRYACTLRYQQTEPRGSVASE